MTDKTEPLDLDAIIARHARGAAFADMHPEFKGSMNAHQDLGTLIAEVRRLRGMFEFEADEALRTFYGCVIMPLAKFEEYERAKIASRQRPNGDG